MTAKVVDLDDILRKVQKLLNVEGRTPEEAALYVERAHAILAEYDLSIESVANLKADPRTAVAKSGVAAKTTEGKPDSWKADVLEAVAAAFECRVLWAYEYEETKSGRTRTVKHGNLVGFGHDVESAGYANSFVVNEITRLAKEYAKTHWDAIKAMSADRGISNHDAEKWYTHRTGTHPLKAEVYFVKGAAQTISESLQSQARARQREAVKANPNALVVQKSAEVAEFLGRERFGDEWEGVKARRAAQEAEWKASGDKYREEAATKAAEEAEKRAKETPAQTARREAREAKERAKEEAREARENQKYWNQYLREQAKTDHSALQAGQQAGRTINIRPGIGGGIGEERHIG